MAGSVVFGSIVSGRGSVEAVRVAAAPAASSTSAKVAHATSLVSLRPPLRLAFYYPWFPETWRRPDGSPGRFSRYRPSLGFYRSGDLRVVRRHIAAMRHGRIHGGIVSWWGPGSRTDRRMPTILRAAQGTPVRFAVDYELESTGNPSPRRIAAALADIRRRYSRHPNYLRIGGRFVVFVDADAADGCGMARRWRAGRVAGVYVVLKAFPGYQHCSAQPNGWHQYAPAVAESAVLPYAYSISPGFFKADEPAARLGRDVTRFRQSAIRMARSGARFQLVTTFNEWGEGTAVESAAQWRSRSGQGGYLDALRTVPIRLRKRATPPPPPGPPPGSSRLVAAAGDIACDPSASNFNGGNGSSDGCREKAVSDLIVNGGYDAFLPLGDTQYEKGAFSSFMASYDPTFGRVKAITHPAVGNHEYLTSKAAGYFQYFGAAAGDPAKGYYSYNIGSWHLIAVNSQCGAAGGCGVGSPQHNWLKADLAASKSACTLAYWHHPRFSAGPNGSQTAMEPIWKALWDAGAEVVLSGHDHSYQRFAPQTSTGVADAVRGIREFVVGTGGKNHTSGGTSIANREVVNDQTFGILRLTLHPNSYDWQFVPEAGKTFTDSGSTACH